MKNNEIKLNAHRIICHQMLLRYLHTICERNSNSDSIETLPCTLSICALTLHNLITCQVLKVWVEVKNRTTSGQSTEAIETETGEGITGLECVSQDLLC